jgi:hypothetical protein
MFHGNLSARLVLRQLSAKFCRRFIRREGTFNAEFIDRDVKWRSESRDR